MGTNKKKQKLVKPISTIVAFVVSVLLFLFLYHSPLELFPENDTYFDFTAVSDGNFEDGNTTTSIDTSNRHLEFEYTLGEENETPYAMVVFHAHELFRPINLKQYDYVDITLHPEESNDFKLTLYTYVQGFSNPGNSDTHRPYSMICHPSTGQKEYRYPLADFATPGWWFSLFSLGEEDLPEDQKKQITHLSISDATMRTNESLKITIEKLEFKNYLMKDLLLSVFGGLISALIVWLVSEVLRKKRNRSIKKKLYHANQREVYTFEQKEQLLLYLSENYQNPLLTLLLIEKETRINSYQVGEIIGDNFKMRYKEYLTSIRIEESKRLLRSSDTPVAAIGESVGYCYANSFSRAFRAETGETPNQYRKSNQ